MADHLQSAPLLPRRKPGRSQSNSQSTYDDLCSFRLCLRLLCLYQNSGSGGGVGIWRTLTSWVLFLIFSIIVPAISHFLLSYSPTRRSFDTIVELSLTAASTLSYLTLSRFIRRYGLRRFLALDKVHSESDRIRLGYTTQLNRSFRLLSLFVAPCFLLESIYKIWWYCTGAGRIPIIGSSVAIDTAACALELASWMYRTGLMFLVCVMFRLTCYLQILRLQEFAGVFEEESDVELVLSEHLRIRRQLKIISHRFRGFIVCFLVLVTASQFAALFLTTRPRSDVNFFNAGELALCSVGLVSGLLICLRSAAKITHQAQAITSHAAKWHVCATIESFETDPETPQNQISNVSSIHDIGGQESEDDDCCDEDDDVLDSTKLVQPHAHTISFQKRQALVTYLENNKAGITVFGFVLDRAWLHTIFMVQLTLFLWVLGKTIGIS
ncbi:hypothetical protein IHE45_09G042200 [Dioscorea alata]|uniref:Uncharacterized protein n=1 Tax=Dioscorea alata TaxID=55571 RepID=A0ACB7VEM8_DIOAL|nr:hypothetical protein IHE45_09G042200 [Dioscorea alata]